MSETTSDFGVLQNALDKYDTSTYHFRLYMVKPKYFKKGEVGPESEQIIIAESGSTAIGIDSVSFQSTHGYESSVQGSGTAIKFNISLMQPFNANLFDQMYSASLALGIPNFNKCPYYLDLYFLGNDPSTSQPTMIDGYRWTWMLQFITVDTEIKSNGSTYTISAVDMCDIAFSDQACVLQEASVISDAAQTVERAFEGLVNNLENKQRSKGTSLVYDEWNIVIVGEDSDLLRISPIIHSDPQSKTSRQDNLHFSDGTSIQKAIDEILASSKYFQDKAKASRGEGENKSDKDDLHDRIFKTLPKIIPDIEILDYDPFRGDYARRYTYNVTTYKISTVSSSPDEGRLTQQQMAERADAYSETHRIRKHYNYLYTGKNQQVYNLDLKFKMAWFVSTPRRDGTTYVSESAVGAKYDERQIENNRIVQESSLKMHGEPSDDTKTVISEKEKENVSDSNKLKEVETKIKNNTNQGEMVDNGSLINEQNELKANIDKRNKEIVGLNGGLAAVDYTETEAALAKGAARGKSVLSQLDKISSKTPFSRYVEDFAVTENTGFSDINANRRLPLTFLETNEEDMVAGAGGVNNKSKDKTLYSAIFAQGNRANGADLIRIDLSIKGDPFWLGQSRFKNGSIVPNNTMILNEISGTDVDKNITTHHTKENYFLFTTQTPDSDVIFNESPTASFSNKTMINGIYGVITSKHTFSGGKFSSVLSAVIDYVTDIRLVDIENFISGKKSATKPDIVTTSESGLTAGKSSTTQYQKEQEQLTQKIKEQTDLVEYKRQRNAIFGDLKTAFTDARKNGTNDIRDLNKDGYVQTDEVPFEFREEKPR